MQFLPGKGRQPGREQCSGGEHGTEPQVRHSHSAYQTHRQKI